MFGKLIACIVSKTLCIQLAGNALSKKAFHIDIPRDWYRRSFLKLRKFKRTEVAIAMATKTDEPILRGCGCLDVLVSLLACREGNGGAFLGFSALILP